MRKDMATKGGAYWQQITVPVQELGWVGEKTPRRFASGDHISIIHVFGVEDVSKGGGAILVIDDLELLEPSDKRRH